MFKNKVKIHQSQKIYTSRFDVEIASNLWRPLRRVSSRYPLMATLILYIRRWDFSSFWRNSSIFTSSSLYKGIGDSWFFLLFGHFLPLWLDFCFLPDIRTPGRHWPRRSVWGCAARKTPFSRLSCRSQRVPFQAKESVPRPPFEKIWKFYPMQPQFYPNFSSQAPKFGKFQLTSPQIWKVLAHKPPNLEIFHSQAPLFRGKCQFTSPTLRKSGSHTPTWKKSWVPPPRIRTVLRFHFLPCLWMSMHACMYVFLYSSFLVNFVQF